MECPPPREGDPAAMMLVTVIDSEGHKKSVKLKGNISLKKFMKR